MTASGGLTCDAAGEALRILHIQLTREQHGFELQVHSTLFFPINMA